MNYNLSQLKAEHNLEGAEEKCIKPSSVPVQKPDKQKFFRVNPSQEFQEIFFTIELKALGQTYIVLPSLKAELNKEIKLQKFFLGVDNDQNIFLWPVAVPGRNGRTNPWWYSALNAAYLAMEKWIRLVANLDMGFYEYFEAKGDLGEPMWPEMSMEEIINLSMGNRIIDSIEHPVVKQLRGEVV